MSWMVYRSSRVPKAGHYNAVLVISNSWQGHAKLEISNLSSVKRSFSSRPFKARRNILNNCLGELDFASLFIQRGKFWFQWLAIVPRCTISQNLSSTAGFWDHILWFGLVALHLKKKTITNGEKKKRGGGRVLTFPVVNDLLSTWRLSTACIQHGFHQNFFLLLNWYETFILGLVELHM